MKTNRTLSTVAVFAACTMFVAMAVPAAALPEVDLASPASKSVMIKADRATLEEIMADPAFTLKGDFPYIGWISGSASLAKYAELKARADILLEDDIVYHIQCHNPRHACDGGGDSSRPTPSDQTPYGIEQIYKSSTITATSGGAGVVLGHIDTGIDTDHVDLVNRIVYAEQEDKNGHGTHTAGTASADAGSDDLGIWGVAPEATIRSYKGCGSGGLCFTSDLVASINDCTNNGARKCDVITYSIGGDSASSSTYDAIVAFVNAGGIFIAAAGNDGPDLGSIDYPAAHKETVAVAAIDVNYAVTDFSSRGVNDGDGVIEDKEVELAGGGRYVESTWNDGAYHTISGTSMATPHVAGLALKKWTGSGDTTRSALQQTLTDITKGQHAGTGEDPASGFGLPHV